jgi:hypothetical protein
VDGDGDGIGGIIGDDEAELDEDGEGVYENNIFPHYWIPTMTVP